MSRGPRRRWVIRQRPDGGGEHGPVVVVEAPHEGPVSLAVQDGPVQLQPGEVERLRQALALARAVVIWDRGRW